MFRLGEWWLALVQAQRGEQAPLPCSGEGSPETGAAAAPVGAPASTVGKGSESRARPARFASRSVRRALLTSTVNPGSLYRGRRST